jgi:hypothetical protein
VLITVTLTPSEEQIYAGIPKEVLAETDIPALVFYTLDNSTPTSDSEIYLDRIIMPTDQGNVTLKVWATNGIDSSEVITETYKTDIVPGRQPRDMIKGSVKHCSADKSNFPYGDQNYTAMPYVFANTGGMTVDDPDKPNYFDGYNGTSTGTWANGTDQPPENYPIIGVLPKVNMPKNYRPDSSSLNKTFFNPRAMVLYQDNTQPVVHEDLNTFRSQHFSLPIQNKTLLNTEFTSLAQDSGAMSGNMLRSQYNPRDNTYTDYLFDSRSLRWIIIKEPAPKKPNPVANLSNAVFDVRERGVGKVFHFRPFGRRELF